MHLLSVKLREEAEVVSLGINDCEEWIIRCENERILKIPINGLFQE